LKELAQRVTHALVPGPLRMHGFAARCDFGSRLDCSRSDAFPTRGFWPCGLPTSPGLSMFMRGRLLPQPDLVSLDQPTTVKWC